MERIWKFAIFGLLGAIITFLLLYTLVPSFAKVIYENTMIEKQSCCSCHKTAESSADLSDSQSLTTTTGQIGDTFGGTIGPFVAIIAAILTFFAFYIQYEANQQQKKDLQIERFENKFYAMLEIHRNNVNELYIGKTTKDRKAFISMFNELKLTFLLVEDFYRGNYSVAFPKDVISSEARYNISYLIFFFGVGPNSSPIIIDLIGTKYLAFFNCLEPWMQHHQVTWKTNAGQVTANTPQSFYSTTLKYKPFNGHLSKLSHYLRHLYQLVKFIDDADKNIFTREKKYNYATTVRAQLSVHEQLLLFYNAVSILGKPWVDQPELLKNYCLIKSSALTLADFYRTPIEVLGVTTYDKKPMFEWSEIKNRINNI